ncbi:hypothetical protein [uncultured Clostridium sp.]|uniref:hypothetical protein n=1 Tax=uncultured Clostridium sp. TaxID=59620 RepID=UPI0025FFFC6F|nr:hypothetical protein [uncultured Clostridium sp.]
MYTDSNYNDDEFSRMQEKIKDAIDNMVTQNHIYNKTDNSDSSQNTTNNLM